MSAKRLSTLSEDAEGYSDHSARKFRYWIALCGRFTYLRHLLSLLDDDRLVVLVVVFSQKVGCCCDPLLRPLMFDEVVSLVCGMEHLENVYQHIYRLLNAKEHLHIAIRYMMDSSVRL